MNDKLKTLTPVFTFLAGTAVGAAASWFLVKKKYEKIADEEIKEMRQHYLERIAQEVDEEVDTFCEDEYEDRDVLREEVEAIIEQQGYSRTTISATQVPPEEEGDVKEMDNKEHPYVIPPEEFDELDGYNAISLTYYSDGILADEYDNVIDDIDEIVGLDSLNQFGVYEDDSVFVRNDKLKSDYEILLDNKTFEEVTSEVE